MSARKSSYEGLQKNVRKLKTPPIEVWTNQYKDKDYLVNLDLPEFTCICPKTGLPDFAVLHISYRPDQCCLELKSLKMYMNWFRNVGIFHEHLVNRVRDDLVWACRPRWLQIVARFNVRGGIITTVTAQYEKKV